MAAHTNNFMVIEAPRPFVFKVMNDLTLWTAMFTEYEKVEILEQQENYFVFRLTTKPDEDGEVRSWVSWRRLFPDEFRTEAARLESKFPFSDMQLRWSFEAAGDATLVRWQQDFILDPAAPYTEQAVIDHLNTHSKIELTAIRDYLEELWAKEAYTVAAQS